MYVLYFLNNAVFPNTATNTGIESRRFNLTTLAEIGSRTLLDGNGGSSNHWDDTNTLSFMRVMGDYGFCFHARRRRRNDTGTIMSNTERLSLVSVFDDGRLAMQSHLHTNIVGNPSTFTQAFVTPDGKHMILTCPNGQDRLLRN